MNCLRQIVLALAAIFSGMAAGAATVSLSAVCGHPGDEVTVGVALSGDEAVTAIDLTIPLDDNLTYVSGSAALTGRAPGHQVSASAVNGALRLVAYSLDLSAIAPGEGDVVTFRLRLGNKPGTFSLSPTVVLGDATGASVATTVSSGSVTDLCPELTIETERIDFGHVPIRSTYSQSITLRNSGNEPLVINSLTASSDVLTVAAAGEVIEPGASRSYTMTFTPTRRGAFTADVEIDSNAANNLIYNRRHKVEVVADPFSVNELHILCTEGASDTEATVTVRVNNMEPLVGAQFSLQLPSALKYVEGSAEACSRATGSTVTANVDGNGRLTLLLYSLTNTPFAGEDGDLLTFRLALEGRSGWYYLSPEDVTLGNADMENMTSAVEGNYVVIQSPTISGDSDLSFGLQPANEAKIVSYLFENRGQAPLVVDRVTFLADGYTLTTPLPLTIAPWSGATLNVEHSASTPGAFSTTMNIYSNDPEQRMKSVTITGTAYSPNELWIATDFDAEQKRCALSVNLTNHAEISAVQFDLRFDHPDQLDGDPVMTLTERSATHTPVFQKLSDGVWRVLLFSLSNTPIQGNDGAIADITFSLGNDINTDKITFSIDGAGIISDLSGHEVQSPENQYQHSFTLQFPGSIAFDKERYSLKPDMALPITVEVGPAEAIGKDYTLTVADESVATLSQDGTLTGIAEGITTITATTWNGISASAEVYVTNVLVPVESITLDCSSLTLLIDNSRTLVATVIPHDADDTSVTWQSSNAAVASVDLTGLVTAHSVGTAIITATASNGMTAQCEVTVTDVIFPVTVNGVVYDLQDNHLWVVGVNGTLSPELRLEAEVGGNRLYGIRNGVFRYQNDIFHCVIPEGVEVVECNAFEYSMLTMIVFPSTLRELGSNSFNGVDLSVIIDKAPESVSLINATISQQDNRLVYVPDEAYTEYAGSSSDSPIYPRLTELFEQDGLWFVPVDDHTVHLISCRADIPGGEYIIPATVRHNGADMNVVKINRFAFDGMSRAYSHQVDFVKTVNIPASVTEIAPEAFSNINLDNVIVNYADPSNINAHPLAFSGVDYDNCILTIPEDTQNNYASIEPWSNFIITSTNMDSIDIDDFGGDTIYYNLHGVRVNRPVGGIYIRRQGAKVEKVVVQ